MHRGLVHKYMRILLSESIAWLLYAPVPGAYICQDFVEGATPLYCYAPRPWCGHTIMISFCTEAWCIHISWILRLEHKKHDSLMHRGLVHKSLLIVAWKTNHYSYMNRGIVHKYIRTLLWMQIMLSLCTEASCIIISGFLVEAASW